MDSLSPNTMSNRFPYRISKRNNLNNQSAWSATPGSSTLIFCPLIYDNQSHFLRISFIELNSRSLRAYRELLFSTIIFSLFFSIDSLFFNEAFSSRSTLSWLFISSITFLYIPTRYFYYSMVSAILSIFLDASTILD